MVTAHQRRHHGYVTPYSTINQSRKFIIANCLEPQPYYNDWYDCRDGQRDWYNDRTKLKRLPKALLEKYDLHDKIKDNNKIKKMIKRRMVRSQCKESKHYKKNDTKY